MGKFGSQKLSYLKNKQKINILMKEIKKISDLSNQELKTLLEKLGGEAGIKKIINGQMNVKLEPSVLIDENGRFIPLDGLMVCEPDLDRVLKPPTINYQKVLHRCNRYFPDLTFSDLEYFEKESKRLVKELKDNKAYCNLLNGPYFPILLPQFEVKNYGGDIENIFLKAMQEAYKNDFKSSNFIVPRELSAKQISVVNPSHRRLLHKMAVGPVVGIMFFPFQGYSFSAIKSLSGLLSRSWALPGALALMVFLTIYNKALNYGFQYQSGGVCIGDPLVDSSIRVFVDHNNSLVCKISDTNQLNPRMHNGLIYLGKDHL